MATYPDNTKVYANLNGVWTDISASVVGTITSKYGISGNSSLDRLAETGNLKFTLNNESGQFSPDSTSTLSGWKTGIGIKLVISFENVTFHKFLGRIEKITVNTQLGKLKTVSISAVDWLDYSAKHPMISPEIESNKRGDEALTSILSSMPIQPASTSFDVGTSVFPNIFDGVGTNTRAYSELSKVALSEVGYIYLQRDSTTGEKLIFESNHHRNGLRELTTYTTNEPMATEEGFFLLQETGDLIYTNDFTYVSSFDGTMQKIDIEYGKNVINRFSAMAYPKKVDTSNQVLFTLSYPMIISSGETINFRGNYSNPEGGGTVSGKDMVTPVATTDYLMNTNSTGTGTDITAYLTISAVYGSEGASYTLTNTYGDVAYITKLQARGIGIYDYNPIEISEESNDSVDEYGYVTETLRQKYQTSLTVGKQAIESFLERDKRPELEVQKVHFLANTNDALMLAFLHLDIGSLIHLKNTGANIEGYFYIQGIEFSIEQGGIMRFSWILREAFSLLMGLSMIGMQFTSANNDAVNFGYYPTVSNLSTRSISAWIHPDFSHTGRITSWATSYLFYLGSDDTLRVYHIHTGSGAVYGVWKTDSSVSINTWSHVTLTHDLTTSTNAPKIYLNGVLQNLTTLSSPAGAVVDETGSEFVIGNSHSSNSPYDFGFNGAIKDVRVYNKVLDSTEITSLYNSGTPNYFTVTDGLVFQGFTVRTKYLNDYVNKIITDKRIIDNVYWKIGKPVGSSISGRYYDYPNDIPNDVPLSIEATSTKTGNAVSSVNWTHNVSSHNNRLLVVAVSTRQTESVTSISIGDYGFAKLGSVANSSGDKPKVEMWYLINPPSGTNTITVNLSANSFIECSAIEIVGANQTTPFGTLVTNYGSDTTPTVTVTDSSAEDSIIIDALSYAQNTTATNGSNKILLSNITSDGSWRGITSYKDYAYVPVNTVMDYSLAGTDTWAILAVRVLTQ